MLIVFSVIALLQQGCIKEEDFITDNSAKLSFSLDTLRFDTVFTEIGSATRYFKIFNTHNKPIKISRIYIKDNTNGIFNLNVDGFAGRTFTDIEIPAKDSIYLFAEVTINPNQPDEYSPFVIEDEIIFETNGNTQAVKVEAWGQNANYIPSRWGAGTVVSSDCGGEDWVWDDPRPYVIYGVLAINNCHLIIPAGTKVYVHGGLVRSDGDIYNDGIIVIQQNAKLSINGTKDRPVIIQSDRLEEDFSDASGQWAAIVIQSEDNHIENAIIKNSIIGIRVDSAASLSIKNTQIKNTALQGLIAISAQVEAENCSFVNTGTYAVQLEYGGNYNFSYCTISGYGIDKSALRASNYICRDVNDCEHNFSLNRLESNFVNCIITGSIKDQIELATASTDASTLQYNFSHCLFKVNELANVNGFPDFYQHCTNCTNLVGNEKLFKDVDENDFHLDSLSVARDLALPIPSIPTDLEGNVRDQVAPDAGCYEWKSL